MESAPLVRNHAFARSLERCGPPLADERLDQSRSRMTRPESMRLSARALKAAFVATSLRATLVQGCGQCGAARLPRLASRVRQLDAPTPQKLHVDVATTAFPQLFHRGLTDVGVRHLAGLYRGSQGSFRSGARRSFLRSTAKSSPHQSPVVREDTTSPAGALRLRLRSPAPRRSVSPPLERGRFG